MSAKRPTSDYKNKTNVNPVNNRTQEATAEDYLESAEVMENHADILDVLTGSATPNPNYGVYSSLVLLQAAHPTGEAGAYAIIDTGYGSTPQLAIWDTTDLEWSLSVETDPVIFALNFAALPTPGIENSIYITQDDYKLYTWKNNQYNELSKSTGESGTQNIDEVLKKGNITVENQVFDKGQDANVEISDESVIITDTVDNKNAQYKPNKIVFNDDGDVTEMLYPEASTPSGIETIATQEWVAENSGSGQPPVDEVYANITTLISEQNSQLDFYQYLVQDASSDPTVDVGQAIYLYLGTTVGDLTDYLKIWESEESTGGGTALETTTDTTNFNKNLSAADTDVQKALQTFNDADLGGGSQGSEYTSIADAMAVFPLPDNNTPFIVRGKGADDGYYIYDSNEAGGYFKTGEFESADINDGVFVVTDNVYGATQKSTADYVNDITGITVNDFKEADIIDGQYINYNEDNNTYVIANATNYTDSGFTEIKPNSFFTNNINTVSSSSRKIVIYDENKIITRFVSKAVTAIEFASNEKYITFNICWGQTIASKQELIDALYVVDSENFSTYLDRVDSNTNDIDMLDMWGVGGSYGVTTIDAIYLNDYLEPLGTTRVKAQTIAITNVTTLEENVPFLENQFICASAIVYIESDDFSKISVRLDYKFEATWPKTVAQEYVSIKKLEDKIYYVTFGGIPNIYTTDFCRIQITVAANEVSEIGYFRYVVADENISIDFKQQVDYLSQNYDYFNIEYVKAINTQNISGLTDLGLIYASQYGYTYSYPTLSNDICSHLGALHVARKEEASTDFIINYEIPYQHQQYIHFSYILYTENLTMQEIIATEHIASGKNESGNWLGLTIYSIKTEVTAIDGYPNAYFITNIFEFPDPSAAYYFVLSTTYDFPLSSIDNAEQFYGRYMLSDNKYLSFDCDINGVAITTNRRYFNSEYDNNTFSKICLYGTSIESGGYFDKVADKLGLLKGDNYLNYGYGGGTCLWEPTYSDVVIQTSWSVTEADKQAEADLRGLTLEQRDLDVCFDNCMLGNLDADLFIIGTYGINSRTYTNSFETGAEFEFDRSSIMGAYNYVLRALFEAKPTARVIILGQHTFGWTDTEIVNDIQGIVANKWGITFMNWHDGLSFNEVTRALFCPDDAHPSAEGKEFMADYLLKQFPNLI